MNNLAEEDLASLSEMFPACDVSTLKNYLQMFSGDPNYMSSIVNMLLEADNLSSVEQGQNLIPRHGLKRSATSGDDCLQNEHVSGALTSPSKALKNDFSTSVAKEIKEEESKHGMFGRNTSEFCTSKSSVTERKDQSPRKLFKHDFDGDYNKATSSSEEDEIVFVKSVVSPPKSCFHRSSGYSDTVISSPQQGTGICIRYKGGALHPSMSKPKKLQIVELYDDDDNRKSGVISRPKKAHPLSNQSPSRKGSSTSKCSTSVTETSVEMDDILPKFCTSVSQEKATENNADVTRVNSMDHPQSTERNEVEEVTSTENNHLPVAEALTDLEILRKVFPEADPKHISSLLDKYANQANPVAFVGKELGSNQGSQSGKKKQVQSVPNWFWQTGEGKLVPFTDSECNTLEKEFSSYSPSNSVTAFVKIRLPGSAKRYDINFADMIMTCDKGQKTIIVRAPSGSDDNKQIGGKTLVPQEALSIPTDWQQQTDSVELINVRPGSAEWDHVQRSLKRSMRTAQVADIQRVQNKWLYRKYAIQRHLMKDKNGPTCINEKELFHGTRHTKPDVIWKGEDGFDMRHSADGMWGRGTYFATEASYCHHGFVHFNSQRRQYQLFLAHVLTGDSVFLAPNRNIKMPPPKRGSDIRYDSVNGFTNGCTVYILYKLDMAYPAYLITYTVDD